MTESCDADQATPAVCPTDAPDGDCGRRGAAVFSTAVEAEAATAPSLPLLGRTAPFSPPGEQQQQQEAAAAAAAAAGSSDSPASSAAAAAASASTEEQQGAAAAAVALAGELKLPLMASYLRGMALGSLSIDDLPSPPCSTISSASSSPTAVAGSKQHAGVSAAAAAAAAAAAVAAGTPFIDIGQQAAATAAAAAAAHFPQLSVGLASPRLPTPLPQAAGSTSAAQTDALQQQQQQQLLLQRQQLLLAFANQHHQMLGALNRGGGVPSALSADAATLASFGGYSSLLMDAAVGGGDGTVPSSAALGSTPAGATNATVSGRGTVGRGESSSSASCAAATAAVAPYNSTCFRLALTSAEGGGGGSSALSGMATPSSGVGSGAAASGALPKKYSGVWFDPQQNCWRASWVCAATGKRRFRYFSAAKFGHEHALQLATETKERALERKKVKTQQQQQQQQQGDLGGSVSGLVSRFPSAAALGAAAGLHGGDTPQLAILAARAREITKVPGVYYDGARMIWRAFWHEGGRRVIRYFTVNKHGFRRAHQLALLTRKQAAEAMQQRRRKLLVGEGQGTGLQQGGLNRPQLSHLDAQYDAANARLERALKQIEEMEEEEAAAAAAPSCSAAREAEGGRDRLDIAGDTGAVGQKKSLVSAVAGGGGPSVGSVAGCNDSASGAGAGGPPAYSGISSRVDYVERVAQLPPEPQVEWCEALKAWVVTPADDEEGPLGGGPHRLVIPESGKTVLKMFTIRKFGFRVARERALEWRNKRREKAMQESSGRRSRPATHANATMLLEPTPSAVSAPASAVSPSYSTSTCASTPSPSASPAAAVVPASAAAAGASSGSDVWSGMCSSGNNNGSSRKRLAAAAAETSAAADCATPDLSALVPEALPVGSAGGTAAASSGGGSGSVEVMRSAVCHILRNLQQCISRILTSERASGADEQLAVDIHKWSQAVYVQLDLFSSFAQLACESRHPDAEALVSEMLMPYLRLFAHCIRLNKLPSQLPEEYQLLLLDALCILGTPDTAGKVELQQQQQEEALRGAAALMLPDTNADLLSLPPTPDATTPSGAASALAVSPAALATPHA
ncbi:spidroin-1 [Cyclospora cayetanensis]|uniref:Spidroin-1 n=1 Tax=Cyclospora cayetanensis TaxID=88456 RepID=A0A6P6RVV1_9EIME|nr:spidroin-1 [Cyclospora cayetanensis]